MYFNPGPNLAKRYLLKFGKFFSSLLIRPDSHHALAGIGPELEKASNLQGQEGREWEGQAFQERGIQEEV
jgi:hypothetical protein